MLLRLDFHFGWQWQDSDYLPVSVDTDEVLRSVVFPGLALAKEALLAGDLGQVLAVLRTELLKSGCLAFNAEY